ncbi:MAG: hypothetical protein ABSA67_13500 [Candidatus Brocadiia bacterium]|jgi:hypothetical protein
MSVEKLQIAALPLHDAVLYCLRVDWSSRTCTADMSAFVDGLNHWAQPRRLTWKKIQEVVIPLREPWGPSEQINSARQEEGAYLVEMQSGDVIRIVAESIEFT